MQLATSLSRRSALKSLIGASLMISTIATCLAQTPPPGWVHLVPPGGNAGSAITASWTIPIPTPQLAVYDVFEFFVEHADMDNYAFGPAGQGSDPMFSLYSLADNSRNLLLQGRDDAGVAFSWFTVPTFVIENYNLNTGMIKYQIKIMVNGLPIPAGETEDYMLQAISEDSPSTGWSADANHVLSRVFTISGPPSSPPGGGGGSG